MVRHATAKLVKCYSELREKQCNLEEAAQAYRDEQAYPTGTRGKRRGLRAVAEEYGVARSTLQAFLHGRATRLQRALNEGRLYPEEEEQLVRWIEGLSDRNRAPSNEKVVEMASRILHARDPDGLALGTNWITRFKARHSDRIDTTWGSSSDTQRAQGVNPTALERYFKMVSRIYEEEDVPDSCRYGADETGFQMSSSMVQRVIGRRGVRRQSVQQSGDRDTTTAVATVCADGTFLAPFVIFKGDRLRIDWGEDNPGEFPCVH